MIRNMLPASIVVLSLAPSEHVGHLGHQAWLLYVPARAAIPAAAAREHRASLVH